jgi:hypothetical protein
MPLDQPPEASPYRVTLFFGPEAVEDRSATLVCVFNVKKRSWKAGIQVAVELAADHLSKLAAKLQLTQRLAPSLDALEAEARAFADARVPELFAQAVAWCKLDLRLTRGLGPEDVRLTADRDDELDHAIPARQQYVLTYILTELDLPTNDRCGESYGN